MKREQQKIDEEEALYQEQKRKESINRANRLLFYNNDRVKTFHSTLLASDVLKERELQIKLKEQRKDFEKREKQYWEEIEAREVEKWKDEIQRRDQVKHQKAMEAARMQREQLTQVMDRKRREEDEKQRETEMMKRQIEEFKILQLREEELRKKGMQSYLREITSINDQLKVQGSNIILN